MAKLENHWCKPYKPHWVLGDGSAIQKFHTEHCTITDAEWQRNCLCIDRLLKCIYEKLQGKLKRTQEPCVVVGPFVRQGSSREGTKVYHADEFDAVLPFQFANGILTATMESPNQSLPAGIAKIRFIGGDLKLKFKREENGNIFINSKVLHGEYFEGMIISAVDEAKVDIKTGISNCRMEVVGRSVNPPAITLDVKITDIERSGVQQIVNVDIVPAYEIQEGSKPSVHRRFLVSRWIPKERSRKMQQDYGDSDLLWRISSSHFETEMFQPTRLPGSFPREAAKTLTSSYMFFKALKALDSRKHGSSQFHNVLRSYYLKNAFFYVVYFIQTESILLQSISQGLAFLVFFVQKALERKCLPQFFTDRVAMATYFPLERKLVEPKKENLLIEKNDQSVYQAKLDMQKALDKFGLTSVIKPHLDAHGAKIDAFFGRVVTRDI